MIRLHAAVGERLRRCDRRFVALCPWSLASIAAQIPTDAWPTYHGDYIGPPLQHAQTDQHDQRQEPDAGLGLSAQHVARRRDRRRRRAGHAAAGRQHAVDQVDAADAERHPVFLGARSRLGGRRADRPRDLALRLEDARRRPHRQPRRRHPRQLALLPDARQLLRLARRGDRQGALAPRDREHEARVLLDQRAHGHRPAGHHRRRRRRARHSRLPRVARSGERQPGLALEHDAARRRARRQHLARRGFDGARRRHAVASGHLRSRAQSLLLRHRQPATGAGRTQPRRATTSIPARSSRSTPTPGRWRGTTR